MENFELLQPYRQNRNLEFFGLCRERERWRGEREGGNDRLKLGRRG